MSDVPMDCRIRIPFDLVYHMHGHREWSFVDDRNLKSLRRLLERARDFKFNYPPIAGTISFDIRISRFIEDLERAIKRLDPEDEL